MESVPSSSSSPSFSKKQQERKMSELTEKTVSISSLVSATESDDGGGGGVIVEEKKDSTEVEMKHDSENNSNNNVTGIHESVQEYYGSTLTKSTDLKTNACCTIVAPPKYIIDCMNNIHDDVLSKYYGCGFCIPNYDLKNCAVLDLGCGSGRDVYITSQLIGEHGVVVGIDMTHEQLRIAQQYDEYHRTKFGYQRSNTKFVHGYLESMNEIPELQPKSFDVIISNCVVNLCTNKRAVLQNCYNLLRNGGEFYFSDVYTNRRIPTVLQNDSVLYGECLSGALYYNDFMNMAKSVGFTDPRLVSDHPITIENSTVQDFINDHGGANIEFYSATYRLFKIETTTTANATTTTANNNNSITNIPNNPGLESACEDYGQAVVYNGTIPKYSSVWSLDKHHHFEVGKIERVCGNTYLMLRSNNKIARHFTFYGNFTTHYGLYDGCYMGPTGCPFDKEGEGTNGRCC